MYQKNLASTLAPVWIPSAETIANTHIAQALQELNIKDYSAFHRWSVTNFHAFWAFVINQLGIVFRKPAQAIVDLSQGVENPRWLPGSKLNIMDSCFQAKAESTALIYPENNNIKRMTYGELNALTNRVANSIVALGYQPGDALAINMPMHVLAVAIYLGIIKTGCVVVAIADSFSPSEIAVRLAIGKAKGIFTQDIISRNEKKLPLYEKVKTAEAPRAIVLGDAVSLRQQDISWSDFLKQDENFNTVACDPDGMTTLLFSSGTTGSPKAIPWTHTTAIKAASDAYFHHDIHSHDIFAWPTNLGWMMGPWLVYAALINQAAIALYEDVATTRAFGEFVEKAQVTCLGLVPSLVKTWRQSQCMQGLDWQSIKAFSSTGECSNPDDMMYLMQLAGNKPIIEYCGGTEIGGAYVTSTLVQPNIPSTFSTPALGIDFVLLDEQGHESSRGEVALIPPSMGLSITLLNENHHHIYYENMPRSASGKILRRHGDEFEKLENGYYRALGRADDTMNLGAIKVSSVEIERALSICPDIIETAAIAVNPPGGGPSQLIIFAHTNNSSLTPQELRPRLQKIMNEKINPLFKIHEVILVDSLPRTASNKVMRRVLRDEYTSSH